MSKINKIIVKGDSAGSRLDVFLSSALGISRSQTGKMIDNGLVEVNEKTPKKAGSRVKDGDVISIKQEATHDAVIPPTKYGGIHKTRNLDSPVLSRGNDKIDVKDIKIVAETPDYIVINKPSGMLTHSTNRLEKDSLAELLAEKYPELKKVGEDPVRPGIVHRLDKEASGLLVVARTQKMFDHLKNQFKKRTIEKEYIVLAHGKVAKDWDEINFPIARSRTTDRMSARPLVKKGEIDEDSKTAKTEFLVEKRFVNFTLLRVKIYTGRMHQIRAHLLAYNHPVVGDPLYFQKKRKRMWDERLGRLFLHCSKLGFVDLTGTKVSFESRLPKELEEFLLKLK
ncbi:RluA family pseudouridine synthase [Patescibacteria group bacterium]|nr:RluA family pseudouridine synthase [Patescibacteria group bacterium]